MTRQARPPVPETLAELLTPEWLTAALSTRFPGVTIDAVELGPVDERISTNARFEVSSAHGLPEGLNPHLCAKGYFSEEGRPVAYLAEPEAHFYSTLAAATGVRTLRGVYSDVDPTTRAGIIITEDAVVAGGRFLDALTPYTPDEAAQSLGELARLHASTSRDIPRHEWLAPRFESYVVMRGVEHIRANFDGSVGVDVDDAVRDPQRLFDAFGGLAARDEDGWWSVIHGDAHVGNLFLDADGRPGLVDWQLVQRGHWGIDVGYHVASALTTDDRERHERDLLAHYLDCRRGFGADTPGWDDAWDSYRAGTVYGFFMWGITLLVDPAIIRALLQRLSAAVAALDSYSVLGV